MMLDIAGLVLWALRDAGTKNGRWRTEPRLYLMNQTGIVP